jgi:hypothetical protein
MILFDCVTKYISNHDVFEIIVINKKKKHVQAAYVIPFLMVQDGKKLKDCGLFISMMAITIKIFMVPT